MSGEETEIAIATLSYMGQCRVARKYPELFRTSHTCSELLMNVRRIFLALWGSSGLLIVITQGYINQRRSDHRYGDAELLSECLGLQGTVHTHTHTHRVTTGYRCMA